MQNKMGKFIKEHRMSLFVVVCAIIMLVGLSYAWLQLTLWGEKELTLRAGTLELNLDDSMSEGITMVDVVPISDEEGLESSGYTFTLENTGTIDSGYEIYLDDLDISDVDVRMKDSFVKYQLIKEDEAVGYDLLSTVGENPNRLLDKGVIGPNEKYVYTLRLWIASSATNEVMGTVFKGQLRVETMQTSPRVGSVSKVLFKESNLGDKGSIDTSDEEQTFITGEDPNNYIWYSGKLWRAVSKDTSDDSVKLITQWNMGTIPYNAEGNSAFSGSFVEEWLNDTSVDGFLGNLREPEKFLKMDSLWNATMNSSNTPSKPSQTTMVTTTVGLLNAYEHKMTHQALKLGESYLNNGLQWGLITPFNNAAIRYVSIYGNFDTNPPKRLAGIRPVINLKKSVEIVAGDGSVHSPYRLKRDDDTPSTGTPLNTRYSGEYIRYGVGENNLYRIVSHENGNIKIASAEPLKNNNSFIKKKYSTENAKVLYNPEDPAYELAYFLNHDFLNPSNGFLTNEQISMITNAKWYLGQVGYGMHYKLGKYTDETGHMLLNKQVDAKVGLLRIGELLSGQIQRYARIDGPYSTGLTVGYWVLSSYDSSWKWYIPSYGHAFGSSVTASIDGSFGVRPSLNLKSAIKIASGDGTKQNPFTIYES